MKKSISILIFCFLTIAIFSQNKTYEEGLKAYNSRKFKQAFNSLKPFADSDDKIAQFIVGFCYFNKDLEIKNDSLAEQYLIKSANQKFGRAMGLLSVLYFEKSIVNPKFKTDALVWAEIAAAYDPIQKATSTRHLIKAYMNTEELQMAKRILQNKKQTFPDINLKTFDTKTSTLFSNESAKTRIPEKKLKLTKDPYRDWVSRWKYERFKCPTFYYTKDINPSITKSTIKKIKKTSEFKLSSIYRGEYTSSLKLTNQEKEYILLKLNELMNHEWKESLFPNSERLDNSLAIKKALDTTEKLPTEKEKNMCSIIYTFSKPILLRENKLALFLDQKRYRTNYTQLSFSFYTLENNRWQELAVVYRYYEHK